ncbi:hypothetical protein IFM89_003778 [Coptis chinensis]|uniref:EF-hand domain-containing protein n=1 Tax=Coptis chinensis TaxID=261450 RepID=A0A835IA37_9MAGN|nr:hypothetical protein IFM89_003778 [Coptis chinensis]
MEEIRKVALVYYANSSDETKETVKKIFKSMDANGSGKISINEFEENVKKRWSRFKPELFTELDQDGDGLLDFEEIIVFYYMANCYVQRSNNQSFDLCLNCYETKQFTHSHQIFLDNYAMLTFLWSYLKKKDSGDKAMESVLEGIGLANETIELASDVDVDCECVIL